MGSQGFEPRSWDFSCLSTPIGHHITNLYWSSDYAYFFKDNWSPRWCQVTP